MHEQRSSAAGAGEGAASLQLSLHVHHSCQPSSCQQAPVEHCIHARKGVRLEPAISADRASAKIVTLLEQAGEVESRRRPCYSNVRFSSLGEQLFVHSAFPTEAPDAVFFGPDTYRFARAIRHAMTGIAPSGIVHDHRYRMRQRSGRIACRRACCSVCAPADVILSDINPKALRYSRINASLNDFANVRTVLSDVFDQINEGGNLIISNPPYLVDRAARLYRHGGGELGFELSVRIVEAGIERLYPGGRLFLYTGTPVADGIDQFLAAIARTWRRAAATTATKKSIRTCSAKSSTARPMTGSTGLPWSRSPSMLETEPRHA